MDWNSDRSSPLQLAARPLDRQVHVLWRVERRKQFRVQLLTAAIYEHPHGESSASTPKDS